MKIRRRSEKLGLALPDGVPPWHTLITCTYQKLFKLRDGCAYGVDNGGGQEHKRQKKLHRHELGSAWAHGAGLQQAEAKEEELGDHSGDADKHGDGDGDGLDAHDARTNPLLPKRRKVKSTRYADFAEEATPHSSIKAEKRSRTMEKDNLISAQDTTDYINTVASSKEALIASIFYVFDTLGKSGLTASEVVAIMLEQRLPGLKEGGARHTVQVANVLRRSRHFISIGNKQYLPCRVVDDPAKKQQHGRSKSSKPAAHGRAESCKLYDGSGWHCSREAHPGFSLCVQHLDMINRPLGKVVQAAPTSPAPVDEDDSSPRSTPLPQSDSDREESEDIGPALVKWGRSDRTPGSAPNQKRKMLSLMSIK